MELRHLEYFKAVADELHFRRAAEKLHMSQPPLTRQIKQLEDELGVLLFERKNKKVELTEAGRYLKSEVDQVFGKIESIRHTIKQYDQGNGGQLKIGYISSTYHGRLNEILLQLKVEFDHLTTRLYEVPTIKQVRAIESDKLDIGIVRTPISSDELSIISLYKEGFSMVMPEKFNELFKKELDLKELSETPFIFFNQDYAPHYYQTLMGICGESGFIPNVVHEANNVHSIVRMVENGLGVSILPDSTSHQYSNQAVRFVKLTETNYTTSVVAAFKKGNNKQYLLRFVDLLRSSLV